MSHNDSPYNTEAVQASQWSARDSEREPRRSTRRSNDRNERVRMSLGWAFVRTYGEDK